jgi:hypothetical protein
MAICVSICNPVLDLQYEVLDTGTYTITIVSSLGERYVATLTLTAGDNLVIDPMPPLNESMPYRVIVEVDGGLEEILYFKTYPYQLVLTPVIIP